jgi:predicted O-linked N-acetylglucosamine transferase (SPINDLY family)
MDFYELSLRQRDPLAYIQLQFKRIISNLRTLTTSTEFNNQTVALGYLIEYAKNDIIKWLSLFVSTEKRSNLELLAWHEISWCKNLCIELFTLRSHDLVYWLFVHVPYFTIPSNNIGEWRSHYVEMLDVLYDMWPKDAFFNEKEFLFMSRSACATYALAYQNCINRNVLRKVCRLIRHIFPGVNYTSPNIKLNELHQPQPLSKIRICFISNSLCIDSSVLRDRMGVILGLDRKIFDVYYAATVPSKYIKTPIARDLFNGNGGDSKYIELDESSLSESRKRLEGFDIIVYPEIGMRVFTTLLAYSRLAPIQINTWGHSDTSGIDTIDYYFTSKYFEIASKDNYSESVIELDSLSTYYLNPAIVHISEPFKDRKSFGFTDDDHIYMCLQTSFKISDIFEDCIAEIAKCDEKAKFLLSLNIPYPQSTLKRLADKVGDVNKIVFYPSLDKTIFINLTKISDVMLDSYPFGGCNSSLEAFSFGIPVITWPTNFINGRFTYGFYKYMGIDVDNCLCIVNSKEEYIKNTLLLMNDKALRMKISKEILDRKDKLFNDDSSIIEWNDKLLKLLK